MKIETLGHTINVSMVEESLTAGIARRKARGAAYLEAAVSVTCQACGAFVHYEQENEGPITLVGVHLMDDAGDIIPWKNYVPTMGICKAN